MFTPSVIDAFKAVLQTLTKYYEWMNFFRGLYMHWEDPLFYI